MLDILHLPNSSRANQQIFYAATPTAGTNWQTWLKPRGVSFVQFFVLGGGGGGGAGAVPASGSAGGGGGGSSAQCTLLFPAWALPDVLYISVGSGGAGGNASAGAAGIASYVTIYPATTVNYVLCQANGGGGGGAGNTTTAGSLGAAGTVTPIASGPLAGLGFPAWGQAATNINLIGQVGGAGGIGTGTGAAGTAVFINGGTSLANGTGLLVTGGAGGGGLGSATNSGGAITVPTTEVVFPPHPGGAAGTGTGSGANGLNGYQAIPKLLLFYGGSGGGTSGLTAGGSGGNGGRGGYGSGGGGGGGAITTRSLGGAGGDGQVIATAW